MLTAQLLLIKQAAKVPLSTQFFRRILGHVGSKHAASGKKDLLKGPWSSGLMVQIPPMKDGHRTEGFLAVILVGRLAPIARCMTILPSGILSNMVH